MQNDQEQWKVYECLNSVRQIYFILLYGKPSIKVTFKNVAVIKCQYQIAKE